MHNNAKRESGDMAAVAIEQTAVWPLDKFIAVMLGAGTWKSFSFKRKFHEKWT